MVSENNRLIAGRYELVRELGRGGMGVVWEGRDTLLHRQVAIKEVVLPDGLSAGDQERQLMRTVREARTAAKLNHPGVVAVYDVVEADGRPWIVMELLSCPTVEQVVLTSGALPIREAADVGRQVLSALRAAHEAGILHRDVKPSNILMTDDGRAVLTDFGIATVEGDASLTRTGMVTGSPSFLAPERVRADAAGPASDLWSLGATLYACLVGRSPFERGEPMATLNALLNEEPDYRRIPPAMHPVLRGLLRKEPEDRLSAEEADRLLAGLAATRPAYDELDEPQPRRRGRGRALLAAATAAVVVIGAGAFGYFRFATPAEGAPRASAAPAAATAPLTPPRRPAPPHPGGRHADAQRDAGGRAAGAGLALARRLVDPAAGRLAGGAAGVVHRVDAPRRRRARRRPGRLQRHRPRRPHGHHPRRAAPERRGRRHPGPPHGRPPGRQDAGVGADLDGGRRGRRALGQARRPLPRAAPRGDRRRHRLRAVLDGRRAAVAAQPGSYATRDQQLYCGGMSPWSLLALPPLPETLLRRLLAPLGDRVEVRVPASRDRDALLAELPEAEIVLGDWTGTLVLDAAAVAAAPRLAFVQQPSVGVDGHDLDALAAAGVPLANTPGVSAVAVSEWCLAAALALARRLVAGDAAVRAGEWPQQSLQPYELRGRRVGVVGWGPIGTACAELFRGLGCEVSFWTRTPRADPAFRDLGALMAESDVLVVVIALSEQTRNLVDPARMKAGALLINAARGGVVDQEALVRALRGRHLGGAALDVFETEPPAADDPLRELPNVLLSPHVAGVTPEASGRLLAATVDNLLAAVEGREVHGVVNGLPPAVHRRFTGTPTQ
ncbi:protein kinase [Actinomadura sp. ATCC 31491]|uniref:Protein kinase n=1 Tax=Actinomadura luzonensis TaxID=2805427 RepID=A0ABT0FZU4_9ACTN|nr:NAD(P)-dependent oxidoreductase [Actinomadura luzonensis]MCK2217799.1 protein kinase [Actinomadura luzonensis]